MSKVYYSFIFCFFLFIVNGQYSYIVYDKILYLDPDIDKTKEKQLLFFTDHNSTFFRYYYDNDFVNEFLKNETKISSSVIIRNLFDEKLLLIKDNSFSKDNLFTIDNYDNFNWKIKEETKIILNLKCKMAVGEFRGRQYTAWFTDEIPLDIGPWKFRGLPGAILSISDSDNYFTFEAVKIVLNKNENLNIDSKLKFVFPLNKNQYIPYKEYIQLEDQHFNNIRSKIISSRPEGAVVISSSKNREFKMEKSFEWEETKTP